MLSSSRRPAGEALAIFDPENRDGSDPALPRADALWVVCARRSVRNPVTRPCVGWAGPSLGVFLDGLQDPARVTSLSLGRGPPLRTPARQKRRRAREHSSLRGRYARQGRLVSLKGGKDETGSDRYRNRGHFGFRRLGRGGKCTIWRSGPSSAGLRSCTSLRPCASLWPFSKICPSSLPSFCSSDLSRSP
jgi:hypothetical protein